MLAELRRAPRDGATSPPVRPYGELGVAALDRLALDELRVCHRLARRHAKIDRHIVLVAKAYPFRRALRAYHLLQPPRQFVAIRPAFCIVREARIGELGREAHEVLPEVLLQDAEREPLAIGGLEYIIHREKMRTRVDVWIEAVPHGAEKKSGLEERQIKIRALSFAYRGEDGNRGKGATRHVGNRQR